MMPQMLKTYPAGAISVAYLSDIDPVLSPLMPIAPAIEFTMTTIRYARIFPYLNRLAFEFI
jgi:hypothetical protein